MPLMRSDQPGMERGLSAIEAVISIVISALVVALVSGALTRGQRESREMAALNAMRSDLRDAVAVIARDLRGAAVAADAFSYVSDTAVEFFSPILTGVTCARSVGPFLVLAPRKRSGGGLLTSVVMPPDSGDVALVFVTAGMPGFGSWRRYRVAAFSEARSAGCAVPTSGGAALLLAVMGAPDVSEGAPVQVVRRGRYSVYRSGNGEWNLGYRRCDALRAESCQAIQPVAGPYRARTAGRYGLQFRFFNATGSEIASGGNARDVRRAEVIVRSDTGRGAFRSREGRGLDDSAVAVVAFRNGT
jgi:hypothetical protein